ncbi:2178_t:CDS:2 [Racocetra persica]|uniref:2178_t:CDS:1 n=1 Tax=Racocetra persica TaxID=160502 RepID=A0ACA9LF40_9GLOM|nr:2178_t:CDS:2 [Racocetra persica]
MTITHSLTYCQLIGVKTTELFILINNIEPAIVRELKGVICEKNSGTIGIVVSSHRDFSDKAIETADSPDYLIILTDISHLQLELKARTDELEKTISHYSVEIGKLNAIIVELEKNKTVIAKLKSENAEFRDRITKLSIEMDISLSEELIPEGLPEPAINIPVMDQFITTSQKNNDDDIEFTKSQVVEQELTKELLSSIISAISFEAMEQMPLVLHPSSLDMMQNLVYLF